MRNKIIICAALGAAAMLFAGVFTGANIRRSRVPDIAGYNVLAERIFKGTVPGGGFVRDGLVYFPLRTAEATVEVQIGPKEFVERSGFRVQAGDLVTVIGMPITVKDRQIVLAREVRSMSGVLIVRDEMGLPRWEKDGPALMDPERRIGFSDRCELIP
jgi:hypothetical protein